MVFTRIYSFIVDFVLTVVMSVWPDFLLYDVFNSGQENKVFCHCRSLDGSHVFTCSPTTLNNTPFVLFIWTHSFTAVHISWLFILLLWHPEPWSENLWVTLLTHVGMHCAGTVEVVAWEQRNCKHDLCNCCWLYDTITNFSVLFDLV